MKLLYDHQMFSLETYGGVSRYFCEVMRWLAVDHPEVEVALALRSTRNRHLLDLGANGAPRVRQQADSQAASWYRRGVEHVPSLRRALFKGRRLLGFADDYARATRHARAVIRRGGYDLLHPTYYDPYFLREIGQRPYVMMVPDMIHELFADSYPDLAASPVAAWKARVVPGAAKLLTISESSKRDLVRLLGVPADRVTVVHLGPTLTRADGTPGSLGGLGVPSRFLLHVGGRRAYKSFDLFIAAVSRLLRAERCAVVCAGGGPPSADELSHLRKVGADDLVYFLPGVSDEVLAALYRAAVAYVSCSLYEGFGLPLLDAFACGCPAILSDCGSFPEVAGDAAGYLDPRDEHSIEQAVARVLGDSALREAMVRRGSERVELFSWEAAAAKTLEVYRAALA